MLRFNIQLFAEGGGEGAGGEWQNAAGIDFESEFRRQFGRSSGTAAPKGKTGETTDDDQPEAETAPEGQDAAAETQGKEQTTDPEADFEGLIKGQYKDQFNKRVQGIINERFKTNNAKLAAAEKKAADVMDAFRPYLEKLGLDGSDLEAVKQAAFEDRSNFRSYAVQNNMTVDEAAAELQKQWNEARAEQEAQAQQTAMQEQQQAAAEQERQREIFDGWRREAAEIQKTDPQFDLAKEIAGNAEFRKALDAGMGVQFAYRATHYEDAMAKVAGAVEQQTALKTAQSIANRRNRPPEGGMGQTAGVSSKPSYKNLSDEDFLKIFNKSLR